jgi:hypothetical protein
MLDSVMVLKNPLSPFPFDFGSFEGNRERGSSSKLTFKKQLWFQFGFYQSKLECVILTLRTGHPPNIGMDLKPVVPTLQTRHLANIGMEVEPALLTLQTGYLPTLKCTCIIPLKIQSWTQYWG